MTRFPQWRSICVAAGLMLAPSMLWAAEPTMQITKPIYPWRTETQKTPDKKEFSHCLVKNMYDNGILLLIAENPNHQRRLAIHFPQDKLQVNDAYDLEWQVDRQEAHPVRAIGATPRILAIALDDKMTQEMARGNMLFLRGPNDALVFDMKGVGTAVRSLQDCMTANGINPAPITFSSASLAPKTEAAPADTQTAPKAEPKADAKPAEKPVAPAEIAKPAPAPAKPAPVVSAAPKSVPAGKALTSDQQAMFTRAGVAPKNVMQVPDQERKDKPFDLIWTSGPLFIGFKSEPPIPHQALTATAARFSNAMQKICGGEFLAEGGTIEKRGNRYVMPAEIACSPKGTGDKTPSTVAAMLLVLDTRKLEIYFIEAPENLSTSAVAARDKLQSQIK